MLKEEAIAQFTNRCKSPEELSVKVFNALQERDFVKFNALIVTEVECKFMANKTQTSPDLLKIILPQLIERTRNNLKNAQSNFNTLLEFEKKNNLDYCNSTIVDIKYKIVTINNVRSCKVVVTCACNSQLYYLVLNDAHEGDCWLLWDTVTVSLAAPK